MTEWLRSFIPAPMGASGMERLRGVCGALLGLALTGEVCTRLTAAGGPLLVAPMGASAVLLFAAPASPLAQPWSIVGGNTVAAVIGVMCARAIADPLLAAPVAGACAIGAMFMLRCLHPPSGAVALTAVLGGPAVRAAGFHFVLAPVALNSAILMLAAVAFNNATGRLYPHPQVAPKRGPHETADRPPTLRALLADDDLDAILARYDQVLDISRDELGRLFQAAELRAFGRVFGDVRCAAIMSRDVIAVQFGTPTAEAWAMLLKHDIRALPVIDPARRVIGMVSDRDFLMSAGRMGHASLARNVRALRRRAHIPPAGEPEVVGLIMRPGVRTVRADTRVVDLVPLMADAGLRHIAVIDGERRLCGIIAQSDLVAALFRGRLMAQSA